MPSEWAMLDEKFPATRMVVGDCARAGTEAAANARPAMARRIEQWR
jgi:hypothetical protein